MAPSDPTVAQARRPRPRGPAVPSWARAHLPRLLAVADLCGVGLIAGVLLPAWPAAALGVAWCSLLSLTRCQEPRLFPLGSTGVRVVCQVALGMVVVSEIAGATLWPASRARMVGSVAVTLGWLVACRIAEWGRAQGLKRAAPRTVVVVGARPAIMRWMEEVASGPAPELVVVAACVLGRRALDADLPTVFGVDHAAVAETVATYAADAVLVVPCAQMPPAEIRRLAWDLESCSTELLVAPGLPDLLPRRATLATTGSVSVLHVRRAELTGVRRILKGIGERTIAAIALLALLPVLLVLVTLIRLDSPGPAVYRQRRIGRGGRVFTMYKLRTMVADAERRTADLRSHNDVDGLLFKMRSDPRVTRIGQPLRRYSLDEIPQLWNVVRGDMALVGPRPALPEEVALYSEDMRRRMVVKPGLTGLWQVSGRSDLAWNRAMQLDLYYVDNWSLGLDVAILLRTVHAVFSHGGAY